MSNRVKREASTRCSGPVHGCHGRHGNPVLDLRRADRDRAEQSLQGAHVARALLPCALEPQGPARSTAHCVAILCGAGAFRRLLC